MTSLPSTSVDHYFISFSSEIGEIELPEKFTNPFAYDPHALAVKACDEVKTFLSHQDSIDHNFGLIPGQEGKPIGKMFGVLVVQKQNGEVGYLTAFSGKIGGGNHHAHFVPPVYDGLKEGSFVNLGMTELTRINEELKELQKDNSEKGKSATTALINHRTKHCTAILDGIVDSYHFLNSAKASKGLRPIFMEKLGKKPPGGAGECALPKLLQFAFLNDFKPVAMSEFWWGKSSKTVVMEHGAYYPSCLDKCEPILEHMLEGLTVDD